MVLSRGCHTLHHSRSTGGMPLQINHAARHTLRNQYNQPYPMSTSCTGGAVVLRRKLVSERLGAPTTLRTRPPSIYALAHLLNTNCQQTRYFGSYCAAQGRGHALDHGAGRAWPRRGHPARPPVWLSGGPTWPSGCHGPLNHPPTRSNWQATSGQQHR